MQNNKAIDEAVERLAALLRNAKADTTAVSAVNDRLRSLVLPARSEREVEAHNRVQDTLASQRAVALLRTEARLHQMSADRGMSVVRRLQAAALAGNDRFRRSVLEPAAAETARMDELAQRAAEKAVEKEEEFVKLRREANCAVSILLAETERKFDGLFQKALSFVSPTGVKGADACDIVYGVCHSLSLNDNAKGLITQPQIDSIDPTSSEYLVLLRNGAQGCLSKDPPSDFRCLADHLAKAFNGTSSIAPIKGYERTVTKAQEKYGGDYSRLLDLARGMVIMEDLPGLAAALEHLKAAHDSGELRIVRAKDRFSPRHDASRLTNGYRDVLLNIDFGSGHIVELQLHLEEFLKLKNSRGHVDYEAARSIHMFNEAFSHCSFRWLPEADKDHVDAVLKDISEGVTTSINMDYSEGLWSPEAQSKLAKALLDERCRIRALSLRSCRCGDDFIEMCLPLDDEQLWSPDNRPVCNTVRLGSKLHEGTAGRITNKGIILVLKYLNNSLRVLDLEGCLDLSWKEDVGDMVASTIEEHIALCDVEGQTALPQLQELNLKSTGLTAEGFAIFARLRNQGHLKYTTIIRDVQLREGQPALCARGASSRKMWE